MQHPAKQILRCAVLLGLFSVVAMGLVAFGFRQTESKIAQNEHQALLRDLHALIPADQYDNDLVDDVVQVTDRRLLGTRQPVTVYRARKNGRAVAAILTVTAPDGYNGAIVLLVGVYEDGTISRVRAVTHQETPGLGDAIDAQRSNWMHHFRGRSLRKLDNSDWAVSRDGGAFDQLTGATITSRAVVNAVHQSLIYFDRHKVELFSSVSKTRGVEDNDIGEPVFVDHK